MNPRVEERCMWGKMSPSTGFSHSYISEASSARTVVLTGQKKQNNASEARRDAKSNVEKLQVFINIYLRRILCIHCPETILSKELSEKTKLNARGELVK